MNGNVAVGSIENNSREALTSELRPITDMAQPRESILSVLVRKLRYFQSDRFSTFCGMVGSRSRAANPEALSF
jgi:hypothetical protein